MYKSEKSLASLVCTAGMMVREQTSDCSTHSTCSWFAHKDLSSSDTDCYSGQYERGNHISTSFGLHNLDLIGDRVESHLGYFVNIEM